MLICRSRTVDGDIPNAAATQSIVLQSKSHPREGSPHDVLNICLVRVSGGYSGVRDTIQVSQRSHHSGAKQAHGGCVKMCCIIRSEIHIV